MKTCLSLPVFLSATLLLCGETPATSAPDATQARPDDAVPLEKVAERLKQMDDDFEKQVDKFIADVDAEVAVKRLSDTVAQLLRIKARAERFNFTELSKNIPQDNAMVSAAAKELDGASRLRQLGLDSVVDGMSKELSRRVKDVLLGKLKPEEIASLLQAVQRIRDVMQQGYPSRGFINSWQEHISILGAAKQLAEAGSEPSSTAVSAMVSALRRGVSGGSGRGDLLTQDEIKAQIARLLEPMSKATEDKWAAVVAMIDSRKPLQEISMAIDAYAEAINKFNKASEGADSTYSSEEPNFYRTIVSVLKLIGNGEYQEADELLNNSARNFGSSYNEARGTSHSSSRQQMVTKTREEIFGKVAKLREQSTAEINARMVAVKESTDISKLVADIEKWSHQMRITESERSRQMRISEVGAKYEDITTLMDPLRELQKVWEMSRPQTIARAGQILGAGHREPPTAFSKEFTSLRNRVLRVAYANAFKAPELIKAPYADKEPEDAVDTFCEDLAQRAEWRRLLDILQLRSTGAAQRSGQKEDETISAIRFYLAGKNSELAEQWADAVQAYKNVLRSAASRAPIQAAAESIKAIAKAHPEAVAGGSQ